MGKKFFTWNFDDGLEEDKEIIRILKSCNMGATFNLNSGLFGKRQMIGRIGNLGVKEIPQSKYNADKKTILKYSIHYRIPEDEIEQVYGGFEVASHTADHVDLTKLAPMESRWQVEEDQRVMGEIFQQPVVGFAYPFGRRNERTKKLLREIGIQYARTMQMAKDFRFPEDSMELPVTGWIAKKNTLAVMQKFVESESEEDQIFLMFAHGYELDFNTKECNFDMFQRICDMADSREDILCCSTGDAFRYHTNGGAYV